MGTQDPLVQIEAATLAGGDNNQDRYAYGGGWAFVLDGASSFSETPPGHDGGWYAENLKRALAEQLVGNPTKEISALVEEAIGQVVSLHWLSTTSTCPTSTIALVRWNDREVNFYVLGDSMILWMDKAGCHELTDARLSQVARGLRVAYKERLATGGGLDSGHQAIMREIQKQEREYRNKPAGYWIAGNDPRAARHGLTATVTRGDLGGILICSDGAPLVFRHQMLRDLVAGSLQIEDTLAEIHRREELDPRAILRPRSKVHDDKTIVAITFQPTPCDAGFTA